MKRVAIGLAAVAAVAAVVLWFLTDPAMEMARLGRMPTTPPNVENGRLLFYAGGCSSCHATPGQDDKTKLGGGYALKSPFGTFYVPNISPHPRDGIGAWGLEQFVAAMQLGVIPKVDRRSTNGPSGIVCCDHAYPSFPESRLSQLASALETPLISSTWPGGRGVG